MIIQIIVSAISVACCNCTMYIVKVKVKVKGLETCYSATYTSETRDHAAALYNLGSGS